MAVYHRAGVKFEELLVNPQLVSRYKKCYFYGYMEKKICSKCNKEKPLADFNFQKWGKFGRRADCKECVSITRKNLYIKNKDWFKEYQSINHLKIREQRIRRKFGNNTINCPYCNQITSDAGLNRHIFIKHLNENYIERKKCFRCKTMSNLTKNSFSTTGLINYICTNCQTERLKTYRQTESGKKAYLKATQKYRRKNPEKVNAWVKARLLALKPCKICGTDTNIHRHHPDYDKPLEIIFLCAKHHSAIHKEQILC